MVFVDLQDSTTYQAIQARAASKQLGEGLRRRAGDAYVVLAPDSTVAISFDPYAQKSVWGWVDSNGRVCSLTLPESAAKPLAVLIRQIKAGLVAFPPAGGQARLVTVWVNEAVPFSLGLDQLPPARQGLGAMMERYIESTTKRTGSEISPLDSVTLFFERALEATLSGIGGAAQLPTRLLSDAEALGLSQVLEAERNWQTQQCVGAVLRLAYVLSAGRDLARG